MNSISAVLSVWFNIVLYILVSRPPLPISPATARSQFLTKFMQSSGSSSGTFGGKAEIRNLFWVCTPFCHFPFLFYPFFPLFPSLSSPRSGTSNPAKDLGSAVSSLEWRRPTFAAARHIPWALNTLKCVSSRIPTSNASLMHLELIERCCKMCVLVLLNEM